jgi:pSer/pThr/pTyr-binding forkhead associated (FHA) protein
VLQGMRCAARAGPVFHRSRSRAPEESALQRTLARMPLTVLFRPIAHDPSTSSSPIEVHFDDEAIRIGRGSGCGLQLPHHSVSEQHAVLRPSSGEWTLTDESSRNGTWVNGARLTPNALRTVRDGDVVRVGAIWLELRVDRRAADAQVDRSTRELALEIVGRFLDVKEATVTVVEGPDMGRRLALREEERPYLVGRSSHCDLVLVDAGASREHVRLIRRGEEVLVGDAGAKNGVSLGEAPIATGQTVRWRPSRWWHRAGPRSSVDLRGYRRARRSRTAARIRLRRSESVRRCGGSAPGHARGPCGERECSRDALSPAGLRRRPGGSKAAPFEAAVGRDHARCGRRSHPRICHCVHLAHSVVGKARGVSGGSSWAPAQSDVPLVPPGRLCEDRTSAERH